MSIERRKRPMSHNDGLWNPGGAGGLENDKWAIASFIECFGERIWGNFFASLAVTVRYQEMM